MSNMSSLIDVFRMTEIDPKTRAKIIIKLGRAINHEFGMNATEEVVAELVKQLDPQNDIFKDEYWRKYL